MWQGEVLDVLFQQGLDLAIEEKKPDVIGEEDWKIGRFDPTLLESRNIHTQRKLLQVNYGKHWRINF